MPSASARYPGIRGYMYTAVGPRTAQVYPDMGHGCLICDTTAGDVTVALPALTAVQPGWQFTVCKKGMANHVRWGTNVFMANAGTALQFDNDEVTLIAGANAYKLHESNRYRLESFSEPWPMGGGDPIIYEDNVFALRFQTDDIEYQIKDNRVASINNGTAHLLTYHRNGTRSEYYGRMPNPLTLNTWYRFVDTGTGTPNANDRLPRADGNLGEGRWHGWLTNRVGDQHQAMIEFNVFLRHPGPLMGVVKLYPNEL